MNSIAHKRIFRTKNIRKFAPIRKGKPLIQGVDHGYPVVVPQESFAPSSRDGGWGSYAEAFLRLNSSAFDSLDVRPEIGSNSDGMTVKLIPGEKAGAIPLRSGVTGLVSGGLIIKPRFGWSGVGRILAETGWHAAPEFIDLPMVPGSAREVPPWVLAPCTDEVKCSNPILVPWLSSG